MASSMTKSYMAKPGEVERRWYVVDATDKVLGRLATKLATVLQGKDKPEYTPHVDVGDHVVVVNSERVRITGRKLTQKIYDRYTYYPGGRKTIALQQLLEKRPERVIELAVRRMLPRGPLGRQMFRKLKVYRGPEHPHAAQRPEQLEIQI
jgi:large subunit ribosomal protein L13